MHKMLITLFLVACMMGCEESTQYGQFVVGGTLGVTTNCGRYVEIRGVEPAAAGPDRTLLRLALVQQDGIETTMSYEHVGGNSKLLFRLIDDKEILKVNWNREKDSVTIGDYVLARSKGNSFVVVLSSVGSEVFQGDIPETVQESKTIELALRKEFGNRVPEMDELELASIKLP